MVGNLIFKVKSNSYVIEVPTPRQIIQIESQKALLSGGMYNGIMQSGTVGAMYALDIIDISAYLTTLCPDLIKDAELTGASLLDLKTDEFKELKDAYVKQFVPWANQWLKMIQESPAPVEPRKPSVRAAEVATTAVTEEVVGSPTVTESTAIRPAQMHGGNSGHKMTVNLDDIPDHTELG